jgi:hypothetical protein
MAAGVTRLADVIVPDIFTTYMMNQTAQLSALINSGAVVMSPVLNDFLNSPSGGMTIQVPKFNDLDDDAENISSDDPASFSSPNKIGSTEEVAIRLNRNNSWSSMDLTAQLISGEPMEAIGDRVSAYWRRRLQDLLVSTMIGVFADNAAAPGGGDTHTQDDLTHDISGGGYVAGVTDFSAAAFQDALQTMGDNKGKLGMMMVHSVVETRMRKNNLIDFIPDARGEVNIPVFQGLQVVVDDQMPNTTGIYDTWIFGPGAIQLGMAPAVTPTEVDRIPDAGDGAGQDVLYSRVQWSMHPTGHAWVGATTAGGGPANTVIDDAASWSRVYPERKQIEIARLITRES